MAMGLPATLGTQQLATVWARALRHSGAFIHHYRAAAIWALAHQLVGIKEVLKLQCVPLSFDWVLFAKHASNVWILHHPKAVRLGTSWELGFIE